MKTYFGNKPTYPLPDIEGSWVYVKYPCVAEVKLDGEFNYFESYLINKYGRVRHDFAITQELCGFKGILAGELYYNTGKSFFEEMLSHKFADELKYSVFDILEYEGVSVVNEPLHYRRTLLETFLPAGEHIRLTEQVRCKDKPAVQAFYDKVVAQGYEGIVVKNLDSKFVNGTCQSWFKIKHTDTLDVLCIGYKKGKDAIAIGTEKKPIGAVGNAGVEFGKALQLVKAQDIIGEDKEYFYVKPRYCVEIKHYGVLKSGMLRNPVMIRLRTDKEVKS